MLDTTFSAQYVRFNCESLETGATLTGPDNLIGDEYRISIRKNEDNKYLAYLGNKFDKEIGFIDSKEVEHLQVLLARQWEVHAYLSLVVFKAGNTNSYWGEVLIMAYEPKYSQEFQVFTSHIRKLLQDGIRPQIDFGEQGVQQILAAKGDWKPTSRIKLPKMNKNEVVIKDSLSAKEKMIEQGRAGNKGCFAASYIIMAAVIAAIIAGIAHFVFGIF